MSFIPTRRGRRAAATLAGAAIVALALAACTSDGDSSSSESSEDASTVILKPEDLIGKKIGVQDSNTALFLALLAANDIDPSEVEIVPVQYDPAPLINGEVDGFVAYLTNEAITVAADGYETANLPFADNGLPFVAETFTVTDETLENDRDLIKAFLIAEILGWTEAVNDPEEGSRLAVEVYGADLDLDPENSAAGAIAQVDLVVSDETAENGLFTISDDLKEQTIASLEGAGIEVTADDLFDTSIIEEIYEEYPELIDYAAGVTTVPPSLGSFGDLAVQLSWIKNEEFSGEFFADSKGYYTDLGFSSVSLTPGPSTGVAELVSGTAKVALSDAVSIGSVIANEAAPLKIIGTTYQKNPFTILSIEQD